MKLIQQGDEQELYDFRADPEERNSLSADADTLTRLSEILEARLDELEHEPGKRLASRSTTPPRVGSKTSASYMFAPDAPRTETMFQFDRNCSICQAIHIFPHGGKYFSVQRYLASSRTGVKSSLSLRSAPREREQSRPVDFTTTIQDHA